MTAPEVRDAVSAPAIPRPRSPERAPLAPPEFRVSPPPAPALPPARYPWPEPWGSFRGAVPRTEFWNVETASWYSRGPVRGSRTGG